MDTLLEVVNYLCKQLNGLPSGTRPDIREAIRLLLLEAAEQFANCWIEGTALRVIDDYDGEICTINYKFKNFDLVELTVCNSMGAIVGDLAVESTDLVLWASAVAEIDRQERVEKMVNELRMQ